MYKVITVRLKEEINNSWMLQFSTVNNEQEISKAIQGLNNTINQLTLTDIYRTPPPTAEYTFFSSAYGTFSRIDHVLDHKASLNKFIRIEII